MQIWTRVIAAASLSVAAPAAAELPVEIIGGTSAEITVSPGDVARHAASGFVFPTRLGDMPQREVSIFGPGDAAVYYTLHGGANNDAWITLYVYPASQSLDAEVAEVEEPIVRRWSATRIEPPAPPPDRLKDGRAGWFTGTHEGLSATNGYLLAQRGTWFIKARVTIPDQAAATALGRSLGALAEIPWEWFPAKETAETAVAAR